MRLSHTPPSSTPFLAILIFLLSLFAHAEDSVDLPPEYECLSTCQDWVAFSGKGELGLTPGAVPKGFAKLGVQGLATYGILSIILPGAAWFDESTEAHVHADLCEDNEGGPHWLLDPAGIAQDTNEFRWTLPALESDKEARFRSLPRTEVRVARAEAARSVVVHAPDGTHIACCNLVSCAVPETPPGFTCLSECNSWQSLTESGPVTGTVRLATNGKTTWGGETISLANESRVTDSMSLPSHVHKELCIDKGGQHWQQNPNLPANEENEFWFNVAPVKKGGSLRVTSNINDLVLVPDHTVARSVIVHSADGEAIACCELEPCEEADLAGSSDVSTSAIVIVIVVIAVVLLLLAGFAALCIRKRRKKKEALPSEPLGDIKTLKPPSSEPSYVPPLSRVSLGMLSDHTNSRHPMWDTATGSNMLDTTGSGGKGNRADLESMSTNDSLWVTRMAGRSEITGHEVGASGDAKAGIASMLDSYVQNRVLLHGQYKVLGGNANRRHGGQGSVVFVTSAFAVGTWAIKFFFKKENFDEEVAVYLNPDLRDVLPEIRDIVPNENKAIVAPDGSIVPPFIVMVKGESFDEWTLRAHPDFPTSLQVLTHVGTRLNDLHQLGYAHRDVKPSNVIWTSRTNCWMLIDFASSAKVNTDVPLSMTILYAAPETIAEFNKGKRVERCGTAVDVWALGVMAWTLLTGENPWKDITSSGLPAEEQKTLVVNRHLGLSSFPWEEKLDRQKRQQIGILLPTVLKMLHRDPVERITLQQLLTSWNLLFNSAETTMAS